MLNVKIPEGAVCLTISGLYLPGPFPISLALHYSSSLHDDGPLGRGWFVPYDISLEVEGDDLVLRDSGLELHRFSAPFGADGAPPKDPYTITADGAGGWAIRATHERLTYHFTSGRERIFATAITNRHGNVLRLDRDASGRLIRVTDPLSRYLDFSYRSGRLQRVVLASAADPRLRHQVMDCGYSAENDLSWISNHSNARSEFTYDDHLIVSYTNPLGGVSCATYDERRRCIQVWEQQGRYSRHFAHDDGRAATRLTDAFGDATVYRFDQLRQLRETIDPLGGTTQYVRDSQGSLVARLDPTGQPAVSYAANPDGRSISRIGPTGAKTSLELSAEGDVVAVVDAQGGRWEYERDANGRMGSLHTAGGASWSFQYDPVGRLTSARDPDEWEVRHQWSDDGLRQRISDDFGRIFERQLDMFGRVVSYEGAGGAAFTVRHGASFREIRNADGTVRRYDTDAMGNTTAFIDELGARWQFGHDLYGRLVSSTDPTAAIVNWDYDAEGSVFSITNENGDRLENYRDRLGRVIHQRGFDGCERTFEYDSAGRLLQKVDGNGVVLAIAPDALGRPLVRRFSDGTVVETAYAIGDHLAHAKDEAGTLEVEYDAEYRPSVERFNGTEVRYAYGWSRQPVGIQCNERECRFQYDPRGNLSRVTEGSEFSIAFERNPDQQSDRRVFQTGLEVRRDYDRRGRLVGQEIKSRAGAALISTTYRYDARSNLVEVNRVGRESLSFAHSARGELTEVRRGGQVIRKYAYDRAGNRLQSNEGAWRPGPGNRLAGSPAVDYEHDGEGRRVGERSTAGERSFAFDVRGRLAQVTSTDSPAVRFEYDYQFRRITKTVGTDQERTAWAGDFVMEQRRHSGDRLDYIHDPRTRTPLAVRLEGEWHAIICDHHGEATEVVRLGDETVVWSSEPLGFDWEVRAGADDFPVPFRGAGQLYDRETRLCYQRARFYDAGSGRFISPDPIGVFGGLNFYRYCLNQPLLLTDPFGLACKTEAECDDIFNDIETRATSVDERWEAMLNPKYDLPWQGAPPKGVLYTAAAVGALGTAWAVGDKSSGSIDTHITNHEEEQRGMNNRIQDYYDGQCSKYEDAARAEAMQRNIDIATRPPSMPHLGL